MFLLFAQLACDLGADGASADATDSETDSGTDEGSLEAGPRWLAVGWGYGCHIDLEGALHCWPILGGSAEPVDGQLSPPAGTFTEVATNAHHACALATDGHVECWGVSDGSDHEYGQVTDVPAGSFQAIRTGISANCAISIDGTPTCWGGYSGIVLPSAAPIRDVGLNNSDGWSLDVDGTLTNWSYAGRLYEIDPPVTSTFVGLSVGYYNVCGVTTTGTIECPELVDADQYAMPAGNDFTAVAVDHHAANVALHAVGSVSFFGEGAEWPPAVPDKVYTVVATGVYTGPCIGTAEREVLCTDYTGSDWQSPY